jgi:hypothetical protein
MSISIFITHYPYKKPNWQHVLYLACLYTHWPARVTFSEISVLNFDYVVGMQDMHPLEPAEMVEHLKQGLGKEDQVYTLYDFLNIVLQRKP